jgi:hypothetical protein
LSDSLCACTVQLLANCPHAAQRINAPPAITMRVGVRAPAQPMGQAVM